MKIVAVDLFVYAISPIGEAAALHAHTANSTRTRKINLNTWFTAKFLVCTGNCKIRCTNVKKNVPTEELMLTRGGRYTDLVTFGTSDGISAGHGFLLVHFFTVRGGVLLPVPWGT